MEQLYIAIIIAQAVANIAGAVTIFVLIRRPTKPGPSRYWSNVDPETDRLVIGI